MVRLEFDYDFRYVSKNGQSTKNALKTDRYIPTNDRGHLTYFQSSRAMLSAFVCSPETGRKSAEKADKMGISRKLVLSVSEQEIWKIGRDFNNALMSF